MILASYKSGTWDLKQLPFSLIEVISCQRKLLECSWKIIIWNIWKILEYFIRCFQSPLQFSNIQRVSNFYYPTRRSFMSIPNVTVERSIPGEVHEYVPWSMYLALTSMKIAEFCDKLSRFIGFETATHRSAENFGLYSRNCLSWSLDPNLKEKSGRSMDWAKK